MARGRKNRVHKSNADICRKAADHEPFYSCGYSIEFYGWAANTADIGTFNLTNTPQSFLLEVKIHKPGKMVWIKEVEMVDSLDEMKSWRSVCGKDFPNFEMLDTKIASALNKIIPNCPVQKKGQSLGAESPRKTTGFH